MALQPLYLPPGICKVNSNYASGKQLGYGPGRAGTGRYIDGSGIRFVAGFPEKLAGWTQIGFSLLGRTCCAVDYRQQDSANNMAVGTSKAVYVATSTGPWVWYDITPFRYLVQINQTAQLSVTTGSKIVTLNQPAGSWVAVGGWLYVSNDTSLPGIGILKGWYKVLSAAPITFDCGTAATGNVTNGGGDVSFFSEFIGTSASPIATTSGSPNCVITSAAHGAAIGDRVTLSNFSAVAGLTLTGDYTITAVTTNTFTVVAGGNANATTTGGGAGGSLRFWATIPTMTFGSSLSSVCNFAGWTMAAYGSMLACAPIGGPLYLLNSANGGGHGYPIKPYDDTYMPKTALAVFVTPERFIFALGINGNAMQLAWCDQSDPMQWQSLPNNTANQGRTLQGGGYLVNGLPVGSGISLIFSNKSCFQCQYIGGNTVYSTPLLSDVAGLIGPHAGATLGGAAYWMSGNDFFTYNGAVQRLPSDDIRDFVFNTSGSNPGFNYTYAYNVACGTNRAKNEVWWFYPDASNTENNRYVIYHIDQQCWSIGLLTRTAWCDSHLFQTPFGFDASGFAFQHEIGVNAVSSALDSYIETSLVDISNGDASMDIMGFIPDVQRITGDLSLTINTAQYPEDTLSVDGPFTLSPDSPPRQDLRSDGKLVSLKLRSNAVGADYRLGLFRVDIKPANQRL